MRGALLPESRTQDSLRGYLNSGWLAEARRLDLLRETRRRASPREAAMEPTGLDCKDFKTF